MRPTMLARPLSSAAGIVSCDLDDISIPDLTWSQMCFSNIDR